LRELGKNGCLVFMDFTSVLSKSKEAVNEFLGALREIYDRTWSRDIGTEGGKHLVYDGKVSLIAGVTHAIDRQHEVNSEMGQRCLYFRYPHTEGYQESMYSSNISNPEKAEEDMQLAVEAMFCGVDLSFETETPRRHVGTGERDRLVTIAQLGARARSSIPRDPYRKDVIDVPTFEVPTRMTNQLLQLYVGMEAVGVADRERWAAIRKVSMDSMPLGRRMAFQAVMDGVSETEAVGKHIRVGSSTAKRLVEDLELLGLIRRLGSEWVLSDWTVATMEKAEREIVEEE